MGTGRRFMLRVPPMHGHPRTWRHITTNRAGPDPADGGVLRLMGDTYQWWEHCDILAFQSRDLKIRMPLTFSPRWEVVLFLTDEPDQLLQTWYVINQSITASPINCMMLPEFWIESFKGSDPVAAVDTDGKHYDTLPGYYPLGAYASPTPLHDPSGDPPPFDSVVNGNQSFGDQYNVITYTSPEALWVWNWKQHYGFIGAETSNGKAVWRGDGHYINNTRKTFLTVDVKFFRDHQLPNIHDITGATLSFNLWLLPQTMAPDSIAQLNGTQQDQGRALLADALVQYTPDTVTAYVDDVTGMVPITYQSNELSMLYYHLDPGRLMAQVRFTGSNMVLDAPSMLALEGTNVAKLVYTAGSTVNYPLDGSPAIPGVAQTVTVEIDESTWRTADHLDYMFSVDDVGNPAGSRGDGNGRAGWINFLEITQVAVHVRGHLG